MSGEHKPQSDNPFEYGDELLDQGASIHKVTSASHDMVCVMREANGVCEWYHFKTLINHGFRKTPDRKWEDLTAENWREHVGKTVRVSNGRHTFFMRKLMWFEPGYERPVITLNQSSGPELWKHASIYNDAGEEARPELAAGLNTSI